MNGYVRQTLSQLIRRSEIQLINVPQLTENLVTGVTYDSRSVQPGSIFVALPGAIPGMSSDGHRFIPAAIQNGAAAVVGSQPMHGLAVPYLQVAETRPVLAALAATFYDFPARSLTVIGVTGTDGKTTTANLIFQILLAAGLRPGIISTINAVIGDEVVDTGFHVTTPEAPDVQRYLARMVEAGLTHVVLEATSHGLAQDRVAACDFDIGVVTNITHEHLDYHGTYEAYRSAKGKLVTSLALTHLKSHGNVRLAVLNKDDESFVYLDSITQANKIGYSLNRQDGVWADEIHYDPSGTTFFAAGPGFRFPVQCSLVGDFNVSNCLAAISAAAVGMKLPPDAIQKGIANLKGVLGRMERIDMGQDFTALVDFAHTPNALRVALETTRKMTAGRVIVVFGSAGLRDRAKRRMMAEVSAGLADITILTAEDPRTESLDAILAEMAGAASGRGGVEGQSFFCIPDRGQAIQAAVDMAKKGDLVVACGKGHEQSMAFGEVEYPWDDRIAMRAALAHRLGLPGSGMPQLPTSSS